MCVCVRERERETESFIFGDGEREANGPYSPKGKKWRPRAPGGIMPR